MKSIDVFCHLMPQKYAELAMNESPNKSHMFVRALKMQAMSDMEYRKQVMEGFEGISRSPILYHRLWSCLQGRTNHRSWQLLEMMRSKDHRQRSGPLLWIYRGYPV